LNTEEVLNNILLLGPGFVFVKLFYLFGQQHRRLEWEWVVWSVLASLPIAGVAALVLSVPIKGPLPYEVAEAATRFALAVGGGLLLAYWWRTHLHSKNRLIRIARRSVLDSAWDLVLDNAYHDGYGIAVTVERIDDEGKVGEASYYGSLAAFGYEAAQAEPILFMKDVSRWDPSKGYVRLGDHRDGMLFHRDRIRRVRVYAPRE
jgi:hypothetical protein